MYYDVQMCRLDVQNDKGDTPLHLAARWGYEGIIQVLLENGASIHIYNKSKESPVQCALNSKVSSMSEEPLEPLTLLTLIQIYMPSCGLVT